jgi:hypothetical protein
MDVRLPGSGGIGGNDTERSDEGVESSTTAVAEVDDCWG